MKKETPPAPRLIETYCEKYVPFPNDEESKEYFLKSPIKLFEWGKINETTSVCDCKETKEERKACWNKFINIKKEKND